MSGRMRSKSCINNEEPRRVFCPCAFMKGSSPGEQPCPCDCKRTINNSVSGNGDPITWAPTSGIDLVPNGLETSTTSYTRAPVEQNHPTCPLTNPHTLYMHQL